MESFSTTLAFSKNENRLVGIEEVEIGYKGAFCLNCNENLVASNGSGEGQVRQVAKYFRHGANSKCSPMTYLHRLGQYIVANAETITIPEFTVSVKLLDKANNVYENTVTTEEKVIQIFGQEREYDLPAGKNGRAIDVLTNSERLGQLGVEIHVTNPVSISKAEDIRTANLNCIEIKLDKSCEKLLSHMGKFEEYVLHKAPRHWISNSQYEKLKNAASFAPQQKVNAANAKFDKIQSVKNNRLREHKKLYEKWQKEHKEFCKAVKAYSLDKNKESVRKGYLEKFDSSSLPQIIDAKLRRGDKKFKNGIVNFEVEGELIFKCHRVEWQWAFIDLFFVKQCKYLFRDINDRNENIILPDSKAIFKTMIATVPTTKLLKMLIHAFKFCDEVIDYWKLKSDFEFTGRKIEWYLDPKVDNNIKEASYPFLFISECGCDELSKPWLIIDKYLRFLLDRDLLLTDFNENYCIWYALKLPS